jgi:FkbM family methyltransferase
MEGWALRRSKAVARELDMLMKDRIRELLPRQLKRHKIHGGPLTGCAIYTSWHDYPGAILGTTERPLLEWFSRNVLPGETWLDVGAHYGYTAIALSRLVGTAGRVFAFEPVLQTASCIIRTRELNGLRQLTVIPMGLADHPGVRTLDLPAVRGMADSTLKAGGWSECILTAAFDSFWSSLCGDHPEIHGIKIDVQAMELDVLLGMKELLRRWAPKLVIEFHRGVDRGSVLHLLAACGYSTDWESLDPARPERVLADDVSYAFRPLSKVCASLSTPSSTGRN